MYNISISKCKRISSVNNLPPRLKSVASLVPQGSSVADIGSDHALLPIFLVRSGHSPHAIAVEVKKGPYERSLHSVREAGLASLIEVRCGNGLVPVQQGEVETVVIAGMGGSLLQKILSNDLKITRSFAHLVLQPNLHAWRLREWLFEKGWQLEEEQLVKEQRHLYELLRYRPGLPAAADPAYANCAQFLSRNIFFSFLSTDLFLLFLMGPHLLCNQHPLLAERLELERKKRIRQLKGLGRAKQEEQVYKRIEQVKKELVQLEGLRQWLQTEKQSPRHKQLFS